MTRWEYLTIKFDTTGWFKGGNLDVAKVNSRLNDLGSAGWELVTSVGTNEAGGASREIILILKRPEKNPIEPLPIDSLEDVP